MTYIDSLVFIIADQRSGKSNQIRSLFEEFELYHVYNGYPQSNNIARSYEIHPDIELYMRLSSWHERDESYAEVKRDLKNGWMKRNKRYKVIAPAQVNGTSKLEDGEELFMRILSDFEVRRGFAVWLDPDCSERKNFALSPKMASFLSNHRNVSALAIDSLALHPSASPKANSINARLLADLLFRL